MDADVIVVGAGAAGLAAAADLVAAGRNVVLLEARERIGGRIWTRSEPGVPAPLELGAEFVHGTAPATFALLARAGRAAVDAPDVHWRRRRGRLGPDDAGFERLGPLLAPARRLRTDCSFAEFLDRRAPDAPLRALAQAMVEGFDAADPRDASVRSIAAEWSGGAGTDAPQFRPLGGYGPLLDALAAALPPERAQRVLSSPVRRVEWRRGGVTIHAEGIGGERAWRAGQAVMTLPLGVLQADARAPGHVAFAPALRSKVAALAGLAPGPVLKLVLRFRRAFWDELDGGRYRGTGFWHVPGAAFPTFWTALPVRAPLLTAWAGGPRATALANVRFEDRVAAALATLERVLPDARWRSELEGAWLHDWQQDPYARGAYSYVRVGGEAARRALARPLARTLYFAGEACDVDGESGTVAGALQSGARAARELLAGR